MSLKTVATAPPAVDRSTDVPPAGTLSFVARSIHYPADSSGRDYFWGAFLSVFVASEMLGPLIGWPTFTGRLYALLRVESISARDGHKILWFVLFTLLPQAVATFFAGSFVMRTSWLAALHGLWKRVVQKQNVVLPEARLLQTTLGVIGGIAVTALVCNLIGDLPRSRHWLVVAEAVALALCTLACVAYAVFLPKQHFDVVYDEEQIIHRLPPSARPVEITLQAPPFLKTVVLRRGGACYHWCDATAPVRLDRGHILLLNLGVLERTINAPFTVTSRNAFACSGRFGLDLGRPRDDVAPFDAHAVQLLIDNLYGRADLEHFLTDRLGDVLNDYAADADADVTRLENNFKLSMLGIYQSGSAGVHSADATRIAAGGLNTTQISRDNLALVDARVKARLANLQEYREKFEHIRDRQLQARDELPARFNASLLAFLAERSNDGGTGTAEPAASIRRLAGITHVALRLDAFGFSDKANAAEQLVDAEIEKAHRELAAAEEQLAADRQMREQELRILIDEKIKSIDARMLSTPRGRLLFEQLMKLRTSDREGLLNAPVIETILELDAVKGEEPPDDALPPPT